MTTSFATQQAIDPSLASIYEDLLERCKLENCTSSTAFVGRDSDGNRYQSIRDMWLSQGVTLLMDDSLSLTSNENWYNRAEIFYEDNCPETIDGVLGGFGSISPVDLEASRSFLNTVQRKLPTVNDVITCDCGAGIGRITKDLLLNIKNIKRCDLVESSMRLLSAAPDYIGSKADKCRYYCESLQNWVPPPTTYTIIWIQWVLIYLTDTDVIRFLRRCGDALLPNRSSIIILKENSCSVSEDGLFVLDTEDASVTRSLPYLLKLIEAAGLEVIHQETQTNFPDEIFDVPMLAIQKKSPDGMNDNEVTNSTN